MNSRQEKILVVDDDPFMTSFVSKALRSLGWNSVQECSDGAKALALASQYHPDLILTDVHMQPMDGLEFVGKLRSTGASNVRNCRVIFMTGDVDQATLSKAMSLGISGYIVKPPRLDDLKTRVEKALA